MRTNLRRAWVAATAAAALGLGLGCGGPAGDGLTKYPVRGSVLVAGQPAPGLIVTLHNRDAAAPGNAARPVGVADDAGKFLLSTNADRDGAVAGDYVATFFWPSDNTPAAFDRLGGKFTDPAKSQYRAKVEPRETELPPFRLEATPKPARPAAAAAGL